MTILIPSNVWTYLISGIIGSAIFPVLCYIFKNWIMEKIKQSVSYDYNKKIEELKALLQENLSKRQEVWLIKKDACMKAFKLANAVLSNYNYIGFDNNNIVPQLISIEEARECIDNLACSCDGKEVIAVLKRILFEKKGSADIIVDLRNAVRKELGFTLEQVDDDREKAFIAKLNCLIKK